MSRNPPSPSQSVNRLPVRLAGDKKEGQQCQSHGSPTRETLPLVTKRKAMLAAPTTTKIRGALA
jgi:hypothetical protein